MFFSRHNRKKEERKYSFAPKAALRDEFLTALTDMRNAWVRFLLSIPLNQCLLDVATITRSRFVVLGHDCSIITPTMHTRTLNICPSLFVSLLAHIHVGLDASR
jgi:hypothetical protein